MYVGVRVLEAYTVHLVVLRLVLRVMIHRVKQGDHERFLKSILSQFNGRHEEEYV